MITSREYKLEYTKSRANAIALPFEAAWDLANKLERVMALAVNRVGNSYVLCPNPGTYLKSWQRVNIS